jgi:quinol monooxygenase YgiN
MHKTIALYLRLSLAVFSATLLISCATNTQDSKQLVRLAVITVDSAQRKDYNQFLSEEIQASIQREPGVITLYGVAEKEHPERVTLFETYADSSAYKAHLATPHFQKYKKGTINMVKKLELIPMQRLFYHRKPTLANAPAESLYLRLIKLQINSDAIQSFSKLGTSVMLPGIKTEPGVLAMYATSEKNDPTRISILEIYENVDAYNAHLQTPHYQKYKDESEKAVKSLSLIDAEPISLGARLE